MIAVTAAATTLSNEPPTESHYDRPDAASTNLASTFLMTNSVKPGKADHVVACGKPNGQVLVGDRNDDGGIDAIALRRGREVVPENNLSSNKSAIVRFGGEADEMLVHNWNRDGDGRQSMMIRRRSALARTVIRSPQKRGITAPDLYRANTSTGRPK